MFDTCSITRLENINRVDEVIVFKARTRARIGHIVEIQLLITRRKIYPAELRDALARTFKLRQAADYTRDVVSEAQASRALRRTRSFVEAVQMRGGA